MIGWRYVTQTNKQTKRKQRCGRTIITSQDEMRIDFELRLLPFVTLVAAESSTVGQVLDQVDDREVGSHRHLVVRPRARLAAEALRLNLAGHLCCGRRRCCCLRLGP